MSFWFGEAGKSLLGLFRVTSNIFPFGAVVGRVFHDIRQLMQPLCLQLEVSCLQLSFFVYAHIGECFCLQSEFFAYNWSSLSYKWNSFTWNCSFFFC